MLCTKGETVVEKVKAGVMTFEPFFRLSDFTAKRFADEPLLTIRPYFLLNNLETFFSKSLTFDPAIRASLFSFKTFKTALISSSA